MLDFFTPFKLHGMALKHVCVIPMSYSKFSMMHLCIVENTFERMCVAMSFHLLILKNMSFAKKKSIYLEIIKIVFSSKCYILTKWRKVKSTQKVIHKLKIGPWGPELIWQLATKCK